MRRSLAIAALFLSIWLAPLPAVGRGEIYTYVDGRGNLHFTNVPGDSRFKAGVRRAPASRGIRPGNPARFEHHIREAAGHYGLDPLLIKAIIKVESDFDHLAVSPKGAQGLMQLMPATAAELRVRDPFEPRANILAGSRYFRLMLDRFGDDQRLALAAYNAGPQAVERHGGIPPFAETKRYVQQVLNHYRQMSAGNLAGTDKLARLTAE